MESLILTVVGSVAALLGAIITGIKTKRGAERATRNDDPAWDVIGELLDWKKQSAARIGALEADLEKEKGHSTDQDAAIHHLQTELADALRNLSEAARHILGIWGWIESGAKPPPPFGRPTWPWLTRTPSDDTDNN